MLDVAKIRVCSVVDTHVPDWSACHDTAFPLRLASEEKLLTCKHSFSYLSEVAPLLCRGLKPSCDKRRELKTQNTQVELATRFG
jgi:hypothetical protein